MPVWLGRASAVLVGLTYVLLVFGASVRVHGAGLACPDWPLCFGKVIPPIDFQVSLEFGHRVLAGFISLAYLGLLLALIRRRGAYGRTTLALGVAGLLVLIVQIVLGGLTVLELLAEWTVTSHLLAGNTFCLLLFLIALRIREAERAAGGMPVRRPSVGWGARAGAVLLGILVPAQLALGGLVSSSHAGLVCGSWPTCDGLNWFPTFSGLVGLQLTHRLLAYALIGAGALALALARQTQRTRRAAGLVFLLLVLQAAIGVANVLMRLPVEVTLLHTAGAAAIVLATTWLNHEAWLAPLSVTHTEAEGPSGAAAALAQGGRA